MLPATALVTLHILMTETNGNNDEGLFFDLEFFVDDDGAEDEVTNNDLSDVKIKKLDFTLCSSPHRGNNQPKCRAMPIR